MSSKPSRLTVRSKIWIEDENGEVVFGSGRLRILSAVEKTGSILAAAKALKMSYRAVWGKIKATEERLGQPLLERRTGGSRGGGSELTPFAKALTESFRRLENLSRTTSDTLFQSVVLDALADRRGQAGLIHEVSDEPPDIPAPKLPDAGARSIRRR